VLKVPVTEKSIGIHRIIAGAFRFEENAKKKVLQLQDKGYDAQYIGLNAYGLHEVAYATFNDAKEASQYLIRVKRTDSRDAWMSSVR